MDENFAMTLGGEEARQARKRGRHRSLARWLSGARERRGARAGVAELAPACARAGGGALAAGDGGLGTGGGGCGDSAIPTACG